MSNTTSHIETKLSERIRAVASEYNIPLSRDIMVADDMLEQFATDAHALESRIEALSRQPVQEGKALSQKLRDLREHLPAFGPMDGTVWMPLDDCISRAEELESQPIQTEDPVAWMTQDSHGRTMLFIDINEARTYCDDDEEPVALVRLTPETK